MAIAALHAPGYALRSRPFPPTNTMQVIQHLKNLSEEQFFDIYTALEQKGFGPLDGEVAKAIRFRPQAMRKLPMNQRARRAKSILQNDARAELCYELFGAYLMQHCKELVTGFLDQTGVEHEEGMIENLDANLPAEDKIEPALAKLDQDFKPSDVTLYLSICAEQWPQVELLQKKFEERSAS